MRHLRINIVNVMTGENTETEFHVTDDDAFSVQIWDEDEDITFGDWGFAPEDSAMYKADGTIPAYALFRGPLVTLAEVAADGRVLPTEDGRHFAQPGEGVSRESMTGGE